MNETSDFSKRFFADFITARFRAKQLQKDEVRRASQDTGPVPSAPTEDDPTRLPTKVGDSA